jgi:cellulose synthase/poly-beta-1,6-N-acetylglucosamine synthase-like glycosyltransferase
LNGEVLLNEVRVLSFLVVLLAYTWIGYPVLLWALRWLFGRPAKTGDHQPFVSIIVPVHNEQSVIGAKLEDCLGLEYPPDSLEILVASDGSTDVTEAIVQQYAERDPRIRLLKSAGRAGKSGVQNFAVEHARGDLLFLTDAHTRTPPEVLRRLSSNFADPQVGLVSATVHFVTGSDAVSKGQCLYWRYEYFLRQAESDIGILSTGGGAAMMIRRELYSPIPPRYGDDCILPLEVRLKGYLVLNDPWAVVFDHPPYSVAGELRGRIRMTARNWSGTLSRPALLNPFRFPLTAWGLISHKLLRWLTPFFLLAIFVLNTALVFRHAAVVLWGAQLAFYLSAFIGWRRIRQQRPAGLFGHAFSFCLANAGFLLGMAKVVRNQKIVTY